MVRSKRVNGYSDNAVLSEYYGLSTDTKPTENVATGSVFLEVDTGATFLYDEESEDWTEVESGSSGGGGGGGDSDFSTAEVKIMANISEIEEFCFINPDSARAPGVCAIPMPWELTQDGPLYKIILYKNLAVGVIAPSASPNTLQVTGDIEYEYDEEEEIYIVTITGDGTISLSEQ